MIISAIGIILLFSSKSSAEILGSAPYPPFGLASVLFVGLSSYLLFIGIYSSAISVSQDSKLRQSIRTIAIKESKLLDTIGSAHMEQEIHRRVASVTKESEKMAEETGIESSLSEEEIKTYLEQVMKELRK